MRGEKKLIKILMLVRFMTRSEKVFVKNSLEFKSCMLVIKSLNIKYRYMYICKDVCNII